MQNNIFSRRNFLKLTASSGLLAALGQFNLVEAAQVQDYKALVCIFLFGGNDGHNTVIPMATNEYNAYLAKRGSLALTGNKLLPITTTTGGQYALNYGMVELQTLFQQGKLAVMANTGMLNQPTTQQQYQQSTVPLPTQLFSHSDQIVQMQAGIPNASASSGWGGRIADLMQPNNANTTFPTSISFNGSALYVAGQAVPATNLQPGNSLAQYALSNGYPQAAVDARANAQVQIASLANSNRLIAAADKVMRDTQQLNTILQGAGGGTLGTVFPNSTLGNQLKEVARFINLRSQTGTGRQVFFCGLGGFDTHSGQDYQQWDLLQQVSQAMKAFYDATVEMGIPQQVTAFTLSDFGRSLQPSGTGTDHGWGNHHLVLGGSVSGGQVYGTFPVLNQADSAYNPNAFADTRGVLLPSTSIAQYGATLAKWFGAADGQLNGLFPELANFSVRDMGFMA
ncbi:MAG TPA: DUF1501 domain-containing protein [Acidobacteriota bacterium]|nr:DUF1501 domain-containing protein [Acidobacteriota bacterium]HNG95038.1 DUF1501 domain-containing protein [Acidobacteriota bacterium]